MLLRHHAPAALQLPCLWARAVEPPEAGAADAPVLALLECHVWLLFREEPHFSSQRRLSEASALALTIEVYLCINVLQQQHARMLLIRLRECVKYCQCCDVGTCEMTRWG